MFFLVLMIYIVESFQCVDTLVVFSVGVFVGSVCLIFGVVSYCLFGSVFKIGTFAMVIALMGLFACVRISYLNFESERYLENVQSFTQSEVSIWGLVDNTQGGGESILIPKGRFFGKVLARESGVSVLHSGMYCKLSGYLVEPKSFEEFDYKKYLKHKGVYSILNVEDVDCQINNKDIRSLRSRLERFYKRILPEPGSSLLLGILLGSDQEFSDEFENNVRSSGVSHIVAASGYNISILLIALRKIFGGVNTKLYFLFGLLIIWLFTLLSGFSPSLLRATVMSSVFLISQLLGRNISGGVVLVYALTLLSVINPYILFDIGFMLSFVSTLSLIYFLPCIEDWSKSKFLKTYLFPTLSCTLFTIPISMYYFKTVSWISVFTNMLVLPILESTLFWGLLIIPTHMFTDFFVRGTYLQLNLFVKIVNHMSKFKPLDLEFNPVALCLGIYVILVVWCVYRYPVGNWDRNFYVKEVSKIFK